MGIARFNKELAAIKRKHIKEIGRKSIHKYYYISSYQRQHVLKFIDPEELPKHIQDEITAAFKAHFVSS